MVCYQFFNFFADLICSTVGRKLILAVGDVWPVFLAVQSGTPFIFIGTAKSEYYVRDEKGPLPRRSESLKILRLIN